MSTPDDQRRPRRSAAVIPTPASVKDSTQSSDDPRRRAGVAADRYSAGRLEEYLSNRERVGGRSFRVFEDPDRSALVVRAALGGDGPALRWARALLEELSR